MKYKPWNKERVLAIHKDVEAGMPLFKAIKKNGGGNSIRYTKARKEFDIPALSFIKPTRTYNKKPKFLDLPIPTESFKQAMIVIVNQNDLKNVLENLCK